jgi:hypothetical protein
MPRSPYYLPPDTNCKNLDPCKNPDAQTSNLAYTGPPLPCTDIKPCDDLSTVFQKIDQTVCAIQSTAGIQGIQGTQGAGTVGTQGIQGSQGVGNIGIQGTQGIQGSGSDGAQGTQGTLGESIQGTQGDTIQGAFGLQGTQGIKGSDGTSVNIKGSVPAEEDLPPAGNTVGDGYITENDGHLWIWNGANWVDAGVITGPQGIQGVQGTIGESIQGVQGTIGIQGIIGDSIQGADGTQGEIGSQGVNGISIQGQQGDSIQGVEGDAIQGTQGTLGISIQGTQGVLGIQGEQGNSIQGSQGIFGSQGVIGTSIQGTIGSQGTSIQGQQGNSIQGNIGSQGTQGTSVQGNTGIQGLQGSAVQGTLGIQGNIGNSIQGSVGSQGTSVQGQQGNSIQGSQGIIGTSIQGSQGIIGASIQGSQGIIGNSIQGSQGIIGLSIQGASGIQGEEGDSIQGTLGHQGTQGTSVQGSQGIVGNSIQGSQGIIGTSIQGSVGSQGTSVQGAIGNQGVQGTSVQGTQGTIGIQGFAGIQGTIGLQGTQGSINDTFQIDINRFGFLNRTETTLSFDGTKTLTLGAPSTTWSYYRSGVKHTISGAKTVDLEASPVNETLYFIYIDSTNGTLISGTGASAWTLNDTKVPVATIYWDSTLTPKFVLADERHTVAIDRAYHREHHFADGTEVAGGGTLTGFTAGSTTPANKTCQIAGVKIFDEDLVFAPSTLPDPDGATAVYYILYRTAATTYKWVASDMPFKYADLGGSTYGYIEYDVNGTTTQMSTNNRYCNTYVFTSNSVANVEVDPEINTVATRYFIMQGRNEYTSLASAQNETFAASAGMPVAEGAAVFQITWLGSNYAIGL